MTALTGGVERVQRGDLKGLEGLLSAQAISLNAIFTQLVLLGRKMDG